jgi:hypothetical protein
MIDDSSYFATSLVSSIQSRVMSTPTLPQV